MRKMKTDKVQYSLTAGVNENLQFRTECLQVFRDILIKTTLDDRYKTDLEQSRISLLFSPFVGFVTRNFHQLNFNLLTDISGTPFKIHQIFMESFLPHISEPILTYPNQFHRIFLTARVSASSRDMQRYKALGWQSTTSFLSNA